MSRKAGACEGYQGTSNMIKQKNSLATALAVILVVVVLVLIGLFVWSRL